MTKSAFDVSAALSEIDRLNSVKAAPVEPEKVPVKAKIEYSEEGVCPYCHRNMVRSFAAGMPIHLCRDDRYVAPMSDAVLATIEAENGIPNIQFSS
jgi:hypothetical protein